MAPKTRAVTTCPVFGAPCELSESVLPTSCDVMRYYFYLRRSEVGTPLSVAEVAAKVAERLEYIWHKASIPIVTKNRIKQMITAYNSQYRCLMKPYKAQFGKSAHYNKKFEVFKEMSLKLFDIASCKCVESVCSCPRDRKVPTNERAFLLDQRSCRKMIMGSVDEKETSNLQKRNNRKRKKSESEIATHSDCESLNLSSSAEDIPPVSVTSDNDYVPTTPRPRPRESEMKMERFLLECDRGVVSDRTSARLASAIAQDLGLITPDRNAHVIDRSKIRRQRKKMRAAVCGEIGDFKIHSLYFDGRKDRTRQGNEYVNEEHITMLSEPNSRYVGHITPNSASAQDISDGIMKFMAENDIDMNLLTIIGCDGTSVNTGSKGGIIRLLEERLHRPLHWFICLLHMNELPLRHLIRHIDGVTHGPNSFKGLIGKELVDCETKPVVKFKRIPIHLPKMAKDLSTDQRYLYEICLAVNSGHCDLSLAARSPGKMCHSRWLTTANRILRLYVSKQAPDEKLCCLAEYVVKVYAPVWFGIKKSPSCIYGPHHLHELIRRSRYLPESIRAVIDPVIKRNGYFAHPENLVLAMIGDSRPNIRTSALQYIASSRTNINEGIRTFTVPKINLDAADYTDLVDLGIGPLLEPPLTCQYSLSELEEFVADPEPYMRLTKYPCHTQAVERSIKLVTEAAAAVSGQESREGLIRTTLKSRNIMPVFETKKDFALY